MTDIILNQRWPGGIMKQLGDAAGGVLYNQYAPGGCIAQLYAAAGVETPLDQYAPGGPIRQIEAVIEESGGGRPAWVPADAIIHIDLVGGSPQGRAWTSTDGEVAVDTLLGVDANTTNGWSMTEYDPADLTAHGLVYGTGGANIPPALIGAARTLVLDAATIRIEFYQAAQGDPSPLVLLSADGNDAIQVDFIASLSNSLRVTSWGGSLSESITGCFNVGAGVSNAAAITITGSRIDVAANGSAAITATFDSLDRPPGNPLVAVVTDALVQALVSITLYDALPDTTGLSALSEIT